MQAELDATPPPIPAQILGVNAIGHEGGNDLMVAGRVLPWLQDEIGVNAWAEWGIAHRDVVVLDADNRVTAVFNLTANDLAVPANYDALKALIVDAASP
jgi:hypothetical protein